MLLSPRGLTRMRDSHLMICDATDVDRDLVIRVWLDVKVSGLGSGQRHVRSTKLQHIAVAIKSRKYGKSLSVTVLGGNVVPFTGPRIQKSRKCGTRSFAN